MDGRGALENLLVAEACDQHRGFFFRRVGLDELGLYRRIGLVESFHLDAAASRTNFARFQANIAGAPNRDLFLGGLHDLFQLRVAGVAELVADGQDAGRGQRD